MRLKPGLEFHNGKPVTADDVVYSFERILDPKTGAAGVDLLSDLSPGGIKKVDDLTVQFTLDRPNAIFWEALAFYSNAIVPVGYDPKGDDGPDRHRPVDHRDLRPRRAGGLQGQPELLG